MGVKRVHVRRCEAYGNNEQFTVARAVRVVKV